MVNTTYNSTEDMINKLQSSKGKTKLKFYQNISNLFDEMNIRTQSGNFQFEENRFSKNVQVISKISHEVILLLKFLQTKHQVKKMNITYYDLYHTVVENRDDNEIVVDKYENNYINFVEFITSNHFIVQKKNNVILR